ncbi:hypothetical protein Dimus_004815 [Dionaea muscipula]
MAPTKQASSRDLRHRVLTCLTKLSDRDTHSLAAKELESIIPTLKSDTFSLFINSLSSTSTADKSAVRATSLRLLAELTSVHSNSLSTHLPKLLSAVIRRLRDPDSAVRSACVSAVSSFASHITRPPPFSSIVRPLADSLSTEQDFSAQSAAALCLSAAVDASPEPDEVQIKKLMPKWMKLLKCDGFKAKSSLLTLIRSAVTVCQVGNSTLLTDLVNVLAEFLKSDDWAARKAAAEALVEVAVVERDSLPELKVSCLKTLESRRFDKVKAVREAMNQMVEAWKEIPDVCDDSSPLPQSKDSFIENASDGCYPPRSRISSAVDSNTPQSRRKQLPLRRPSPSDSTLKSTAKNRVAPDNSERRLSPIFRKLERLKPSDFKGDIGGHQASSATVLCGDNQGRNNEEVPRSGDKENDKLPRPRPALKWGLFPGNSGIVGAPYVEDCPESTVVVSNSTADVCRNHKECESLSLIRKQLVQIENQQSSLMDLLQKFMGSSQNGMHSLETRVHGLELALDDISYDLAISNARMLSSEPARSSSSSCCLLPGSEFLRSKLWKRADDRCSTTLLSFPCSSSSQPFTATSNNMASKRPPAAAGTSKLENRRRYELDHTGGYIVNPLAGSHIGSRGIAE